jgi:16S rRNA (adenine(1408)-N(1))-methyltransferase
VIIDLGTGDGRAALAAAQAEPTALVVGLDADAGAMAEVSRRAARPPRKGGCPNVLFAVAAAESPPPELHGVADEIQILFPWGSLLRGVLGQDGAVARGLAALARPGAQLVAVVSVTSTDRVPGVATLDSAALDGVAAGLRHAGVVLLEAEPMTADEVRATRSTWGRRLLAGAPDRPVWRLRLHAEGPATVPADPVRGRAAGAGVSSMD